MFGRIAASAVAACALTCSAQAFAQTMLTATFTRGAIAQYTNNANGTDDGQLFTALGIASITISQISGNGLWGGTQGNDASVTATIRFTDTRTVSFPAAINWVKNAGGGNFEWVGLTISPGTSVADGYSTTGGAQKTYILQFQQSSLSLATLLPDNLDGSANFGAALNALNSYFPTAIAAAPVITGPSGAAGASFSSVSVNEGTTAAATMAANKAVSWALSGGPDAGRFAISPAGVVSFLAAPDFESPADDDRDNGYLITVEATDAYGNKATQSVVIEVLDVDDMAPQMPTSMAIFYAEGQQAGGTLGTVIATDSGGVADFRFAATGTRTSSDGLFELDAAGTIRLTAAGLAAGSAANDFETLPNSFVHDVEARDTAGNWSSAVPVTLSVTDVTESAPVVTGPGGAAGAASSAVSVNEGQMAVASFAANVAVNWAIAGGPDAARFAIDANGALSFVAAPDHEAPADADADNSYVVVVEAVDANGLRSSQTVTVEVLDLSDTTATPPAAAPVVTGPGGAAGAASSAVSVNEGQMAVASFAANVAVNWAIAGGPDAARFAIDANGALSFVAAPDYEAPADADTDNSYLVVVEAVDANGLRSSQTVTVEVLDLSDTTATPPAAAPVVTGPGGAAGAASSAVSVNEGQAAVAAFAADVAVSWAIAGGPDAARFAIDANGALSFVAAPDHEAPADADADNSYVVVVEAVDANGLRSSQTVTVEVLDLAEAPPAVTDSSGGALGQLQLPEGGASVIQLQADRPVTWAISGGPDAALFTISPAGELRFLETPDYEAPADADADNRYALTVRATDGAGVSTEQAIGVTVADVVDGAPLITGPGGVAGATAADVTLREGEVSVARMAADRPVSWAITGGADAALATIAADGTVKLNAAPDYEAPADAGRNNSYELLVEASDAAGNRATQLLTVRIGNVDEVAHRFTEVSDSLRRNVRAHAFGALTDMLATTEGMLLGSGADPCQAPTPRRPLSGALNANQDGGEGRLRLQQELTGCQSATRVHLDAGLSVTRRDGRWTERSLATLRLERSLGARAVLGVALTGALAHEALPEFADSRVSDRSLTLSLYGRGRLSESLRVSAFAGGGLSRYRFSLQEADGFRLSGDSNGRRLLFGAALSGDIPVGSLLLTTDAILSRAVERLDDAGVSAWHGADTASGLGLALGQVDATRLSVPVTLPLVLAPGDALGRGAARLDLSPGIACEDESADVSRLSCGYQIGARFRATPGGLGKLEASVRHERAEGRLRNSISLGYTHRLGSRGPLGLGLSVERDATASAGDSRVMLRLTTAE